MAGLRLYTSNRLEVLADRLAEVLASPLGSPLSQEIVVVQSRGMERWVRMEVAKRLGVCANVHFPFPNAFLGDLFRKNLGGMEEDPLYDPEVMPWRIMDLLVTLPEKPGFEEIRGYLGGEAGHLKAFQLSREIARLFDQYLVFRQDMILSWETGRDGHWQARIWRALVQGHEGRHRAAMRLALMERLRGTPPGQARVPERISIFGISALPPFHLEVLTGLSRHADVKLFLMNPCKEYWAHIRSEREMRKELGPKADKTPSRAMLHLEEGNSLLASMGTLGRDFFSLIAMLDLEVYEDFHQAAPETILSWIQDDILSLRDAGDAAGHERMIDPKDRSIQIHSCHGPMREIEVLKDHLLAMFDEHPDLAPEDVVVMAPDIGIYAPFVQSVFGDLGQGKTRIPFSIADRTFRMESRIAETFMRILDLCGSRLLASEALAILEDPSVLERFGLEERDLPRIHRWVHETGIRWGMDASHRERFDMSPLKENTWRFGLERLLLGQALPGRNERVFQGILPYDLIEGAEVEVLGRFVEFAEVLFSQVSTLELERDLYAWADVLSEVLERFFLPEDRTEGDVLEIRRALHELRKAQEVSGFVRPLEGSVIKGFLSHRLQKEASRSGFMTGGVTFCSMLPMRSIPFKVICLIGMNSDAYPRQGMRLGFDLMAKHPKTGDRSRRNDDRYLFLEAILSARKTLYISYVGQSAQDNALVPPSVLVSELIDYVDRSFVMADGRASEHVVTVHRLQPFSPAYFRGDPKRFSYSEDDFDAARRLQEIPRAPSAFISRGLTEPPADWGRVNLPALQSFFSNPARFLLTNRLGFALEDAFTPVEDTEPFVLDGLERYRLEQTLVEKRLAGKNLPDLHFPAKASGVLPLGQVGDVVFHREVDQVGKFAVVLERFLGEQPSTELFYHATVCGVELQGRLQGLTSNGLARYRYAKLKARDHVRTWLEHLILNAFGGEGSSRHTILFGKEETWVFEPLEAGEKVLADLFQFFFRGLRFPLSFFPETSMTFAVQVLERGRREDLSLLEARRTWLGSEFLRGESSDPYYNLCFRHVDALDNAFRETAIAVYGPLLKARRKR